jgi:hypothetical protein
MARRASQYRAGSAQPFHGADVEYRLSRQYRRPTLMRFFGMMALTVICIVTPLASLEAGAAIFGALAVYFGVSYVWRGRFRTRVTSRGIEARGYFNHFVPWEQVRDVEVSALGSDGVGLDDTFGAIQSAGAAFGARSRVVTRPSTGRRISRLASVSVVRADGHKVRLRAPVVSGWADDPDFDDKARQLHELCIRYGRGAIAQ